MAESFRTSRRRTSSSDLTGRSMTTAGRRGKQMFVGLDDGSFLTIHLGMTGDLVVDPRWHRPRGSPGSLSVSRTGCSLFYVDQRKFGAVGLVGSVDEFVTDHRLGPDALCIDLSDSSKELQVTRRRSNPFCWTRASFPGSATCMRTRRCSRPGSPRDTSGHHLPEEDGRPPSADRQDTESSIAVSSDFSALPDGYLLRDREEGAECPRGNGLLASTRVGGRTSIFCPICQRYR